MTSAEIKSRVTTPKEENDVNIQDPNVGFWEKWNKHVAHKQKTGIIRHASFSNRWMPRLFYFTCFGGTGWMVLASIPHFYGADQGWMLAVEVFVTYVFVQVMSNYVIMQNTDSSYITDTATNDRIITDDVMGTQQYEHGSFLQQTAQRVDTVTTNPNQNRDYPNSSPSDSNSPSSSYRILVATSVTGNSIERKSFPYWSWVPCVVCNRPRPPRCHHCTICQTCVLKRDHHCYFTRVCVGVNNHRYYLYFLLWSVVLAWTACLQLVPYLFRVVLAQQSYWNLIIPINLYTTLTGSLPIIHLYLIAVVWALLCVTIIATSMFSNGIFLLLKGLTSFEHGHKIKVVDTRGYADRMRAVMGRNWAVRCLIPTWLSRIVESRFPDQWKPSEPLEDAVQWPHIKAA